MTKNNFGLISHIQRYSIHDGPGIRTIVFFKGCPCRCLWCSNPELISPTPEIMLSKNKCLMCNRCVQACPRGAIAEPMKIDRSICDGCGKCAEACPSTALTLVGEQMTVEQVVEEIEKDRIFYQRSNGGMTLSGGEALSQERFARDLLKRCKKLGLHTAIETSGFVDGKLLLDLLKYIDLILYDLKIMDRARHAAYVGVPNDLVLANARKLMQHGANMVIRVPLIPQHNSARENFRETAQFAKEIGVQEIHLLPFHQLAKSKYTGLGKAYPLKNLEPPDDGIMSELKEVIRGCGVRVKIGG